VPDWANIGMPIGECSADGRLVITKPEGTGGLVSVGTVAEQLLYEVSDPQSYIVPDVVADFTNVHLTQIAPNRVEVTGARGLGRTATYKASLTYDSGWRVTAFIPIIGLEAAAKAQRLGEEMFARANSMLRDAQRPPLERTRCDVIGGEGDGPTTAICRIAADHPDKEGAQLLAREQASGISHMSVGITLGPAASVRPLQRIAGFLIPKSAITLNVTVDGKRAACAAQAMDEILIQSATPEFPTAPGDIDPGAHISLINLAWARSGDKGNLFNVAIIARRPEYLPYIAAALRPSTVGEHYARVLGDARALAVDAYFVPGLCALNYVVKDSMDGGVLASARIDPVAKGMAQLILDYPIPVSAAIARRFADRPASNQRVSGV
jgi:Acyclic terpene utilisation family protein AtuA